MPKGTIPSEKEALQRAAALCSGKECCISEISEKIKRWGLDADAQTRITERLVDEGFIDERRFCRAYALDKLRYNHWGRIKIDQMMRSLGLAEADRRQALSELPEEEYRAILQRLIQAKQPTIQASSDYERRGKLLRYLMGKGFEYDFITDVIDN